MSTRERVGPHHYAEAIAEETKRRAALAEKEAAMGELEPMSEEDLAAFRAQSRGAPPGGALVPTVGTLVPTRGESGEGAAATGASSARPGGEAVPEGAVALEVHKGPFKVGRGVGLGAFFFCFFFLLFLSSFLSSS